MSSKKLLTEVPRALRDEMNSYKTILPPYLSTVLADLDPEELLSYLMGAMLHQERLAEPESKGIIGVLREIKIVERNHNGKPLGKKVQLSFNPVRGGSATDEVETIMTSWIEHAYPSTVLWDLAISTTLHEIAKEAIDKECTFIKAFEEPNSETGRRPRYLANMWVRRGGTVDRPRANRERTRLATPDLIRSIIERDGICTKLNGKEIQALAKRLDNIHHFGDLIDSVAEDFDLSYDRLNETTPDPEGDDYTTAILLGLDKALSEGTQ